MRNPELCKELLQRILPKLKIDHIEYSELQKSIQPDVDAKRVRLDVYVRDEKETVYDIEMQTTDTFLKCRWNRRGCESRIKRLVEDNRLSDIIKITQDKEYRQTLYKEY